MHDDKITWSYFTRQYLPILGALKYHTGLEDRTAVGLTISCHQVISQFCPGVHRELCRMKKTARIFVATAKQSGLNKYCSLSKWEQLGRCCDCALWPSFPHASVFLSTPCTIFDMYSWHRNRTVWIKIIFPRIGNSLSCCRDSALWISFCTRFNRHVQFMLAQIYFYHLSIFRISLQNYENS